MKFFALLMTIFITINSLGQVVFDEDFQAKTIGDDLVDDGYELSLSSTYTGTVSATVAESVGNKYAQMISSPNGAAGMEIFKEIDIEPGRIYTYSIDSRGPFKRQLRVYALNGELIASSADYKPATEPEQAEWKSLEVNFLSPEGATKVKIAFHHYWSGTIELDNILVTKIGEPGEQTSYYLSSGSGDDSNPGTEDSPWQTLDKISSAFIFPGDTIFFKRGDRFDGHFKVNGSGNEENPILITTYSEGDKPVITGEVGEAGGGDHQEAVLVENHDNLIFDGLEIHNERLATRSGVSDTDAYGIYVKNTGTSVMKNIIFRNMTFKDVFAVQPMLDPDDFNSIQVSGLAFMSSRNTIAGKEKNIQEILIEDSYFTNLQRFGIQFKHGGGNVGIGNDSINRNMNILIQNNEFYYNGGTGVLPNATYNCLIENNIFDHPGASTDPRMPGRGSSIWNINAINTIMQYNMCISTRGYLDSHGIHIDNNNINTFVQYNYMEDCEGGFVEILRGNENAVYRFNVSVNDGWRINEGWADSNHTIWVSSDRWNELVPTDGVYIYNNTCIINKPYTTSINMDAKHIFVYNNIWSSTNGAGMGAQNPVVRDQDTPFTMTNNLFEGTVDPTVVSWDLNPQIGEAKFTGQGEHKDAFQLQKGSIAIDNGATITGPKVHNAGHGVFKDIPPYPQVDFYGNPIDLSSGTPNIGACNIKFEEQITGLSAFENGSDGWIIYPRLGDSKIQFKNSEEISGPIEVSLYSLSGRVIQMNSMTFQSPTKEFHMKLRTQFQNGIYIIRVRDNEGILHSRRIVLYR